MLSYKCLKTLVFYELLIWNILAVQVHAIQFSSSEAVVTVIVAGSEWAS